MRNAVAAGRAAKRRPIEREMAMTWRATTYFAAITAALLLVGPKCGAMVAGSGGALQKATEAVNPTIKVLKYCNAFSNEEVDVPTRPEDPAWTPCPELPPETQTDSPAGPPEEPVGPGNVGWIYWDFNDAIDMMLTVPQNETSTVYLKAREGKFFGYSVQENASHGKVGGFVASNDNVAITYRPQGGYAGEDLFKVRILGNQPGRGNTVGIVTVHVTVE